MKKIKKIVILLLLFITNNIEAKEPIIQYIDNVYSNRISSDQTITGQLGYIYMDGQTAFCIEPFKIIGNNYEINNEVLNNFYTKEEQRLIQLIIHYGAGSHLNDPYYYMATQELIWRIKDDGEYYFTTTSSGDGEKIDIESYKNEILKNVEKHDMLPSFNNIELTPKLYDQIELIDENSVLNNYRVNSSENIITRMDDGINIQVTDTNESIITLSYMAHSGIDSNTYVGNGQTLIISNLMEKKTSYIHIKPVGVSYYLKIRFLEDNRSIFGKVKFKIYNHNTSQYIENGKIFESDMFGSFISDFKLDLGTYEIAYVDMPKGYISSILPNQFILDKNTKVNSELKYEFISYLDVPKGKLIINRNAILYDGSFKNLNGIEYKIYAYSNIYDAHSKLLYEKNELVDTVVINEGKGEIVLPLGKYYLEEQPNNYDVPLSSNQNVTFTYKDSITEMYYKEINITSNLPTLTFNIKTLKENIDSSYTDYSNYRYELLAKQDIIYLNEIVFKEGEIIKIFTSNNEGYIYESLSLPYGEYELREINIDNDYYENDSTSYLFNSENTNVNLVVEKKLKRGNLCIKIYSNIGDISDDIYFVYDKEYAYKINDELFIKNIKIGEYKVIYNKEYSVIIYPNETTLLEIEIMKEIIEDNNKEENNKIDSDEGNKEVDKDDNFSDDEGNNQIDIGNDDILNDTKNDEVNLGEKPDNNKNENIQEDSEILNKDKDDINIDNNNGILEKEEIKNIINEEIIDNDIEIPSNNVLENKNDNVNTLPNTSNYFKKYYYLFILFIISGILFRRYEKN